MSLFSSANMMSVALRNFSTAIQVTGNNVANMNTEGYSRRRVNFVEGMPMQVDTFWVGNGNNIGSIGRIRDIYLDSQIRYELSQVGYFSAYDNAMQELSAIFPDVAVPGSPLGIEAKLTAFFDAWESLAATPTSVAAKQNVLDTAQTLVGQLRSTSINVAHLRENVNARVEHTIDEINRLSHVIAAYNYQIRAQGGATVTNNSLLDARNQAMMEMSKLMDVQFRDVGDGSVTAFFSGGSLVQGSHVFELQALYGQPDSDLAKVGYPKGSGALNVSDQVNGGELGGLLFVRDEVFERVTMAVRAIGSGLIENINTVYHAATDATGQHYDFFTGNNSANIVVNPIYSGASTAAGILTEFYTAGIAGNLASAIGAARDMMVATYIQTQTTFTFGAAASTATLASLGASPINGAFSANGRIHVDLSDGSAAVLDWTNAQSLSQIADNLTQALAGAGIAVYDETTKQMTILSDQPISLYDETGNLANVLRLRSYLTSATNVNAAVDPTIQGATTVDTLGGATSGLMKLFQDVMSNGRYGINGGIANWLDTDTIGAATGNIGLAGGVIAYWNAAEQKLMQFKNVGAPTVGNPLTSFKANDVTGNLAAVLAIFTPASLSQNYEGLRAQVQGQQVSAEAQRQAAESVLDSLEMMQDNVAKVNLDEELANAQAYQRAYEASLKVLNTIDQMLNILINGTGSPSNSFTNSD